MDLVGQNSFTVCKYLLILLNLNWQYNVIKVLKSIYLDKSFWYDFLNVYIFTKKK
jgi:hypothetical protein